MNKSHNVIRVRTPSLSALLLAAAIVSTTLLAACNTVEGAGKDIERAGEHIQDAAK
jgi:predicted small secreted protein